MARDAVAVETFARFAISRMSTGVHKVVADSSTANVCLREGGSLPADFSGRGNRENRSVSAYLQRTMAGRVFLTRRGFTLLYPRIPKLLTEHVLNRSSNGRRGAILQGCVFSRFVSLSR